MALAGIGSAFFWSASRTHIANFCRGKTGAAFGTYVASWGLGWAIGPLIGGALAFFWNIRAPYLFGAIVLAITVIVFMQILPPDKHIKASKSTIAKKLRGGFLKDGIAFLKIAPNGVKQIFLIQMLMYSALQIVLIFAPLYFIKLNNAEIGVLFFVQSIVFAAGGALWGLLAEGSKKFLFVVTGFLASSGVIFLLLKSTDFISAIIFMGIFGLTLALIEPISDAILNDCVDRKARGVANGFSQAAYGLGGGIGPLVGGAVAAIYGISSTFILAIALCLGGVVVGLSLRR
jgi:MFS family permease